MSERFPSDELERFIARVMAKEGLPDGDAADVARLMVARRPHRLRRTRDLPPAGLPEPRIRSGGINKTPTIGILQESASVAVIDGDDGMGHLAVAYAARTAIRKASGTGIGWAGTRNGNHAGAASVYAAMPLEHGMIGIYGSVGGGNLLPPWGGLDPMLSTNPIAVAIPAGDGTPVVMDFATTVASMGKIRAVAQRGETMPEGWMIERDGTPLTDPTRASDGLLLPMGGYKGYALGLVIGLLAGTLNGAAMGEDRRRLQRRFRHSRPIPASSSAPSTRRRSAMRRRSARSGRQAGRRDAGLRRYARVSTRSGCRATGARRAWRSARRTASRSRMRCARCWTGSPGRPASRRSETDDNH